jgi:hypothetical protein
MSGLVIGFIDYLQSITTSIANPDILQFITGHTKSSQFVLISRFLVTDSNNVLCLRPYWLANVYQLTKLSPMLRLKVSRPVCLGIKYPSGACDQILITEPRGARDHILLSQIRDLPLFFASPNSQVYGGSTEPRLHKGYWLNSRPVPLINLRHGLHRKHCSSVVVQLLLARNLLLTSGRCLWSHYLATGLHATMFRPSHCTPYLTSRLRYDVLCRARITCIFKVALFWILQRRSKPPNTQMSRASF